MRRFSSRICVVIVWVALCQVAIAEVFARTPPSVSVSKRQELPSFVLFSKNATSSTTKPGNQVPKSTTAAPHYTTTSNQRSTTSFASEADPTASKAAEVQIAQPGPLVDDSLTQLQQMPTGNARQGGTTSQISTSTSQEPPKTTRQAPVASGGPVQSNPESGVVGSTTTTNGPVSVSLSSSSSKASSLAPIITPTIQSQTSSASSTTSQSVSSTTSSSTSLPKPLGTSVEKTTSTSGSLTPVFVPIPTNPTPETRTPGVSFSTSPVSPTTSTTSTSIPFFPLLPLPSTSTSSSQTIATPSTGSKSPAGSKDSSSQNPATSTTPAINLQTFTNAFTTVRLTKTSTKLSVTTLIFTNPSTTIPHIETLGGNVVLTPQTSLHPTSSLVIAGQPSPPGPSSSPKQTQTTTSHATTLDSLPPSPTLIANPTLAPSPNLSPTTDTTISSTSSSSPLEMITISYIVPSLPPNLPTTTPPTTSPLLLPSDLMPPWPKPSSTDSGNTTDNRATPTKGPESTFVISGISLPPSSSGVGTGGGNKASGANRLDGERGSMMRYWVLSGIGWYFWLLLV